jgi:hypothetical protein
MRRRIAQYLIACLLLPALTAPAWADEAADAFALRFGDEYGAALASPDLRIGAALAAKFLDVAKSSTTRLDLACLLCDRAFELGRRHVDGYKTAIAAMSLEGEKAPDRKDACREKILGLYMGEYVKTYGPMRARAGDIIARMLMGYGDEKAGAGEWEGAVNYYRRAAAIAPQMGSAVRGELQPKLDAATARLVALRQLNALKDAVRLDPQNRQVRTDLVRLYIVDYDDPTTAAKFLDLTQDDPMNKMVLLAAMSLEKLPERACVALGDWYSSFFEKASPHGKLIVMERAKTYYRRFLELHASEDAARTEVTQSLDKVLAVLGQPASAPSVAPVPVTAPPPALTPTPAPAPTATSESAVAATPASPTVTVMTANEFNAKWASVFPVGRNVASKGATATASSHYEDRVPGHIFSGSRAGEAWVLDGQAGWIEAKWNPSVKGRYILLFSSSAPLGTDPWGDATISVNGGAAMKADGVKGDCVVMVDLGKTQIIGSLKVEIKAGGYPGLAGLEVHPAGR